MKKLLSMLSLATFALSLAACGSDSTGPGDSSSAGMTFKVNGVAWTSNAVSKSGFTPGAYIVGTADKNGLTELMGLQLDTVTQGRTIKLGSDSASFSAPTASYSRADGTWKTRTGSGTVTITEIANGRVKGTFSFTLYKGSGTALDSLKVTEGSFNSLF